ncbi:hypothetical protein [Jejuia spongiicola]|uniref:Riboflavin synthase subunit beta n=1 Tax=Jejuia spongiicola TaxID=2942207 RepID=A0ABT0QDV9_9FLAO|nr:MULTISPECIES: hypothetical protein [Flavobacteriaceae]MCL6294175.1 hypothetical protein [Jejuia spongiicola]PIA79617.1 hypothetical protein BFR04_01870 [Gaetbulibacter sp. 4G1]
MGGEGSMMAANNSLKNNRDLISKRKERGGLSGSYSNAKLAEFPTATPEQLNEIREKILKQNRVHKVKLLIVFGVIITVLILFFLYN